jgi:hypothetical protein
MPLNDDRTDTPPSHEVVVSKGWHWDWDVWILNLFKKRRTEDVVSPEVVCEQSVDVSTTDNQDISK